MPEKKIGKVSTQSGKQLVALRFFLSSCKPLMPIFFYFLSSEQIEEECFFMIAEVSRRYDPPFFTDEEILGLTCVAICRFARFTDRRRFFLKNFRNRGNEDGNLNRS